MRKTVVLILMMIALCGTCACSSEDNANSDKNMQQSQESAPAEKADELKESNHVETFDFGEAFAESKENEEVVDSDDSGLNNSSSAEKLAKEYEFFGDYEEVPVWTASASSQLEDKDDYYKYHPEKLYDHDLSTAYVEGESDDGIGQMVKFEFGGGYEASTYAVTRIEICPGYQKSKDVFYNNSRPLKLSFYFSNGQIETFDLGTEYDEKADFVFDIEPVITNSCIMVIEDAISGKKYKDCCISEVTFYSQQTNGMRYFEQDVNYEGENFGTEADYLISGYEGEELVWSYQTHNPLTELTSSAYITSGFGKVIVYDEQRIVALDAYTGDVLWENNDTGFPSACSFDKEGNLFVCGYYGSNVCVIDKDGKTLWCKHDFAGEDYSWASMMILKDDNTISIYYAMYEDAERGIIYTTKY